MQSLLYQYRMTSLRNGPSWIRSSTTTNTTRRRLCRHALLMATTLSPSTKEGFFVSGFCHPTIVSHKPPCYWRGQHSSSFFSTDRSSRRHDSTRKEDSSDSSSQQKCPLSSQHSEMDPRRKSIFIRNPEPEDAHILSTTLDWVEHVVIGFNLCPFAEKPYQSQRLYMEVISGQDETEILGRVLGECIIRKDQPGTSLMICPDLYPNNFETFLQVYNILTEGVLPDYRDEKKKKRSRQKEDDDDDEDDDDLTNHIQIAPFHPLFVFDGSGNEGVDNYTNRSPYPIFHILREEEVGNAVDILDGDSSRIWKRNVELLEAFGDEFDEEIIKEIMSGKTSMNTIENLDIRNKVKEIYKKVSRKTTREK